MGVEWAWGGRGQALEGGAGERVGQSDEPSFQGHQARPLKPPEPADPYNCQMNDPPRALDDCGGGGAEGTLIFRLSKACQHCTPSHLQIMKYILFLDRLLYSISSVFTLTECNFHRSVLSISSILV